MPQCPLRNPQIKGSSLQAWPHGELGASKHYPAGCQLSFSARNVRRLSPLRWRSGSRARALPLSVVWLARLLLRLTSWASMRLPMHRLRQKDSLAFVIGAGATTYGLLVMWEGLSRASSRFGDFQIDGARAIRDGIPIWVPSSDVATVPFRSPAFYGHLLYLILYPLSFLPDGTDRAVFAFLNCVLLVLAVLVLARVANLDSLRSAIFFSFIASSTPTLVAIGNSQTSVLVLSLCAVGLLRPGTLQALCFGLASFKLSFLPNLMGATIGMGRKADAIKFLFGLAVPAIAFVALTGRLNDLVAPFVAQLGGPKVALGHGDLLSVLRIAGLSSVQVLALCVVASAVFSHCVTRFLVSRGHCSLVILGLTMLVSLVTLGHLTYDYVVLAPLVAFWLSRPLSRVTIGLLTLTYLQINSGKFLDTWEWLANSSISSLWLGTAGGVFFSLCLNVVILLLALFDSGRRCDSGRRLTNAI